MTRTLHGTGLGMEEQFGYSRAVSVGNMLFTSATAPVNESMEVVGGENAFEQARYAFEKLRPVLTEAGYDFADVVHIRIYTSDFEDMSDLGRAVRETFSGIKPAMSLVHVLPYPLSAMRLEVELTAVREPETI